MNLDKNIILMLRVIYTNTESVISVLQYLTHNLKMTKNECFKKELSMKLLTDVAKLFDVSIDIDWTHNYAYLNRSIEESGFDINKLRNEINTVLSNSNFDWVQFGLSTGFIDKEEIVRATNNDIKFYFRYMLWSYLYPEFLDKAFFKQLRNDTIGILKNYHKNGGWMEAEALFRELQKQKEYQNIDFLYIYYIKQERHIKREANPRTQYAPRLLKYR